jgi:hypothetical protein
MCKATGCRDPNFHGTQYFAEEFAEKHSRAFIGYSEGLNGALKASSDPKKCDPSSPCLSDSDIDVKEMPLDDAWPE